LARVTHTGDAAKPSPGIDIIGRASVTAVHRCRMADVSGKKLADEALARHPELTLLYTTGYTANAVVHGGVLDAGVNLLGKPFTIEQLAAKLRAWSWSSNSGALPLGFPVDPKLQEPACANFGAAGSFHTVSTATNRMPVTSVLIGSPNIWRPARRSPTTVPAARTATIVSQ
jgi:hypothetical protein